MLRTVIFDLDGLLVDSEPLLFAAYRYAFGTFGFELSPEQWARWHTAEASCARWITDEGLDLDAEVVRDVKKARYEDLVRKHLTSKPGVKALVSSLAGQVRLGIASGSRPEALADCLAKFGLLGYFDVLSSGTSVAHSKPYPDVYVAALRELGSTTDEAIALKDSATGLRAAVAAGLLCIVCPDSSNTGPAVAFRESSLVVTSLNNISIKRLQEVHETAR